MVRKKLGLTLVSEKTGTEWVYGIAVKNPVRKSKGNAVKATDGRERPNAKEMARSAPPPPFGPPGEAAVVRAASLAFQNAVKA